jgi:hypothetical protein
MDFNIFPKGDFVEALEKSPNARRFLYCVLVSVVVSIAVYKLPEIITAVASLAG